MLDKSAPGIVSQTMGVGMQTLPDEEEKRRKQLMDQVSKARAGMVSNAMLGMGGMGAASGSY